MKCGINGAEHDFNEIPCGINGAVRQASELWIGVNGAVKKVWPTFPVGSQVILDEVKSYADWWICPASGRWHIEGHGGGGAGGDLDFFNNYGGGGGGGSGEEYEVTLNANEAISYFIGICPGSGKNGQDTTFGDYTFAGGKAAKKTIGGDASGSLATDGENGKWQSIGGVGGYGNKNKPEQTYGNGGKGLGTGSTSDEYLGLPGAIILTYLG